MRPSNSARYFIAILPPAPIVGEALALKNYFREKYNSKAALTSPPHITMRVPFLWQEQKENELIELLENFAKGKEPMDISLSGFGAFAPRVIFISVEPNDRLNEFQEALEKFCKEVLNLRGAPLDNDKFHPHLTIAFRDLKKQQFDLAWQEFKDKKFSALFSVDALELLKHDGKIWHSAHRFHF